MQELSTKEVAILELLRQSISNGIVPSVREICSKLNIKSTSTVHRYLKSLQEKGYIEKIDNLNRSIRLSKREIYHIPVVGTVAAGKPILATELIEDYIPVALNNHAQDLFALKVQGESMINVGIYEGDMIIARQCSTAENGEIVVAMIDDEATVKRFFKENNGYRLQPENDDMEPIITKKVTILGKVVGLQRLYV